MTLRLPYLAIETCITRDTRIDEADGGWTCYPVRPPGRGWVIADSSSDTKTRWRRLKIVDLGSIVVGGGRHG